MSQHKQLRQDSSRWVFATFNRPVLEPWSSSATTYCHLLCDSWLLLVTQVLFYNGFMELTEDLSGCITFIHQVLTEETLQGEESQEVMWGMHHRRKCFLDIWKHFYLTWLNIFGLWPWNIFFKKAVWLQSTNTGAKQQHEDTHPDSNL